MKRLKKLTAILLSLLMVLAVAPLMSFAADDYEAVWYNSLDQQKGQGTFADAFAASQTTGNKGWKITLNKNVTLTSSLTFTNNVTIKSENGSSLIRGESFTGNVLDINGARVTLQNVTIDGNSTKFESTPCLSLVKLTKGTLNLYGAKLINNYAPGTIGGAVVMGTESDSTSSTTLNMDENAEISGCMGMYGGAVCLLYNASFNLTSGKITNCTTMNDGGAVDVARPGSVFVMSGGEISGCSCSYYAGATTCWASAVSFEEGSIGNITGGKITGNTNPDGLGAIYVDVDTTVTIGGSAYIFGNTDGTNANDIYLPTDGSGNTVNLTIDPAFTEGAKLGITTAKGYAEGDTLSYIKATGDINSYLYDNVTGEAYYLQDGKIAITNCVTVIFDAGKGTCSVKKAVYPIGKKYGSLPTPDEREGFTFNGWYDKDGNKVEESSYAVNETEITLTANWTNDYAVDNSPLAVIGRFFERIANLMKIAFQFLENFMTGKGDHNLGNI